MLLDGFYWCLIKKIICGLFQKSIFKFVFYIYKAIDLSFKSLNKETSSISRKIIELFMFF